MTVCWASQVFPLPLARFVVPVLPDVDLLPRQRGAAEDGVAELFNQHQGRTVRIPVRDVRHDGRVDNAQPGKSVHAALRIDRRPSVRAETHACGPGQMPLRCDRASQARPLSQQALVSRVGQIVHLNARGAGGVAIAQGHRPTTMGTHQAHTNLESMFGKGFQAFSVHRDRRDRQLQIGIRNSRDGADVTYPATSNWLLAHTPLRANKGSTPVAAVFGVYPIIRIG